jgi:pyruvate dehydrogenase E2 component (dihydrolipoamide acetyltransferase)
MAVSVVMPALEMAQETGKLVSWRKKEGEQVTKGDLLLEVETDKAVVEVEALGSGILAGVKAREGDVVPVGQTIAWLVQPGEAPPADTGPTQTGRRTDAGPAAKAAVEAPSAAETPAPANVRISPKARRLAREHGVDISRVRGSGSGGEILAEDILAAAAAPASAPSAAPSAPVAGRTETVSSIGKIMADRTTQSWTTVPHFFVMREVDASALNAAREKLIPLIEKSHAVKVTHSDLLVAAVAHALRQHPRMNGSWSKDGITINPQINIALAMAVENAVVTAVIPNADRTKLADIAVQRRQLAERARAGRLQPADIAGATFTISNLGMFSVDAFTAIIVPPQAGILAVGAITDRVVPVSGGIGV